MCILLAESLLYGTHSFINTLLCLQKNQDTR
ncbi:hypothetical protein [Caudoviricetes sp.]|nr:hypothetical protein [Caudoviricetes sp.]